MTWRAYHILQGLIFAGWGLFLMGIIFSGKILFYINRRFVFIILLAGVALIGLATVVLGRNLKKDAAEENVHVHGDESAGHTNKGPSILNLVILGVPLLLGIILPPRPLSSSVVATHGINSSAPLAKLRDSSTTAVSLSSTQKSVLDWVADFNSAADPAKFTGQQVHVTGFVYHDPRMSGSQFLVGRFVVTCCVADALALGMVVNWPEAGKFTDNSWVQVDGTVTVENLSGQRLPGIDASRVSLINTPDQPYLFP